MLTLSTRAAMLDACGRARRVDFGAYVLGAGRVRDALAAAARRGARVSVTLQRDPYADADSVLRRENAESARLLRAAGAHVREVGRVRHPFHLKAAVVDGTTYLDDRNWPSAGGIVVRDTDAHDAVRVRAALRGAEPTPAAGDANGVALRKRTALAAALAFTAGASAAPLVLATESFGAGPLAEALRSRALHGEQTRLIVDARRLNAAARGLVAGLAAAGVTVTNSRADEKFILAGAAVWVGSANATGPIPGGDQTDWGAVSRDSALVARVRQLAGVPGGG